MLNHQAFYLKITNVQNIMRNFLLCFLSLVLFSNDIMAQHEHDVFHPHHTLGLYISHTQVIEGVDKDGHKNWLTLPSWGLDYNYKFSSKWAIGLHSDMIIESFEVEDHLNSGEQIKTLKRVHPIASAVMASFKPGHHFNYLFGAGGEFASTGNLFLIRVGTEYEYHINKDWEFNANLTSDFNINAYNSWAIRLGITRIF